MKLRLLHPATALSLIALLLGFGSTAFAAGMITGSDIKDGSVTTADIRDGSLRTRDLASSAVQDLHGARGPAGPIGPQGIPGVSGWEIVSQVSPTTLPANTATELHALCPSGMKALSVDAFWELQNDAVQVYLALDGTEGGAVSSGVSLPDKLHLQLVCAVVG